MKEASTSRTGKPEWLKVRIGGGERYAATSGILSQHGLHTICRSGRCPNRGECWAMGTATFLIGGDICTRSCRFCNTLTGKPLPLMPDEPERVAESIRAMGLSHAVLTSVDRDDLPDLGAGHWARTIRCIKAASPGITMEALIPDFQGKSRWIDEVILAAPDIISHNMETVRRLTPAVRSGAKYERSLDVLRRVARSGVPAKSGLMLGLGETEEEILATVRDVLDAGCRLLSIGQYLQPSLKNLPVTEYVTPEKFDLYRRLSLEMGFRHVESAPLIRTSYGSAAFLKAR
jgi:lipoic acid synthetase